MSRPNPYWWAWKRRRDHRVAVEGRLRSLLSVVVPIAVAVVLLPVVRPVFLGFLDGGEDVFTGGLQGIVLRFGMLIVGATAMDVYTALIRGEDRRIFDLHPVDPALVARYQVVRTGLERWWMVAAAALLLLPIALEASVLAWGLAVVAIAGVWLMALSASAVMHLGAVWMAEAESMAPLLDLLRGSNPRAQAAFLYAPGAVLGATGGLVWLASAGVARGAAGDWAWTSLLLLPFLASWLLWIPVGGLAERTWFRASPILSDIDARYSVLEQEDDALRVYLDWMLRFVPARLEPYVLKDLRHGWRARRTLITLSWGVGIGAGLSAWSAAETAPVTAMVIAMLGVFAIGMNGVLMEWDQPDFLREWLPQDDRAALMARAVSVAAWLQVAVWMPLPLIWLRHGLGAAAVVGTVLLACSAMASVIAAVCSRRPRIGLWVYLPVVACIAGIVVTATRLGGVL